MRNDRIGLHRSFGGRQPCLPVYDFARKIGKSISAVGKPLGWPDEAIDG